MRCTTALGFLIAGFLGLCSSVNACSCARTGFSEKLNNADVVALVRVGAMRANAAYGKTDADGATLDFSEQPLLAKFEVAEVYKGDLENVDDLITGYGQGDCGLDIQPGLDVLIVSGIADARATVSICNGSIVLGWTSKHDDSISPFWSPRGRALVDGVKNYFFSAKPIHQCLEWKVESRPWSQSDETEQFIADCKDYFKTFDPERPETQVENSVQ